VSPPWPLYASPGIPPPPLLTFDLFSVNMT